MAVPLGTRSYILHSTRAKLASVTATQGTVQVWPANENDPVAVPDRRAVTEGSAIVTDDKAKALLTLSSDTTNERLDTTIQLDPNTAVVLHRAAPRASVEHRSPSDRPGSAQRQDLSHNPARR